MLNINEDLNRFKKIVDRRVREDLRRFMSNGGIEGVGGDGKRFRVPLPSIDIPRFKYGTRNMGGIGQGEGTIGQPIPGADPEDGSDNGQAGKDPGEHSLEVELSLEELANILGEKLALPRIEPKGQQDVSSERMRYLGRAPVGPAGLRNFRWTFQRALMREISSGTYNPDRPVIIPRREDMWYRSGKPKPMPHAQAVIFYLMDVSGSMGDEEKHIAQQTIFWIDVWLRRHYPRVISHFIVHDSLAWEVARNDFFRTTTSGGTLISSAYQLMLRLIQERHQPTEWNIYPFQFSDGDNWSGEDNDLCLHLLTEEILPVVNQFCYGQTDNRSGSSQFYHVLDEFEDDERLVRYRIRERDKIMELIQVFLGRGK